MTEKTALPAGARKICHLSFAAALAVPAVIRATLNGDRDRMNPRALWSVVIRSERLGAAGSGESAVLGRFARFRGILGSAGEANIPCEMPYTTKYQRRSGGSSASCALV